MTPHEWLEPDGAGGFASGTDRLVRTRRYHALLLANTPTGRVVLVNGIEAWLERPGQPARPITSQRYAPGMTHPDGEAHITTFDHVPWPTWGLTWPDGTLRQEVFVAGGQTNLRWTWDGPGPAPRLHVRLLLSGRDYHATHHENAGFRFEAEPVPGAVRFQPYPGLPPIAAWGGAYTPGPLWFRRFLYETDEARGLDAEEDLASPGTLAFDLAQPASLALRADTAPAWPIAVLAQAEATERGSRPALARSALQYVARTPPGPTILAGFPWFTDWGRDTFIAMRGLLLSPIPPPMGATPRQRAALGADARTRRDLAEQILVAWAGHVDGGMLPNRFPDGGRPPEFNAADASLWFIVATHDLLARETAPATVHTLRAAATAILEGYVRGVRYGIGMEADGLIRADCPGQQLTWMDAKVNDWVVTPRRGKPVEIQALWINALRIAAAWPGGERWATLAAQAHASFLERFPDPDSGGLYDLVDGDPEEQRRLRPNQIFAIGGLPHRLLEPIQARAVVDLVERRLLVPLGLRTLDPGDTAYRPRYGGNVLERDGAYHQGTAWPWLLGPFVEAWLRTRGGGPGARAEAAQFLAPMHGHLAEAGLGHVSEVVDGDYPHAPGGCPFQAWSLGEFMRMEALLA